VRSTKKSLKQVLDSRFLVEYFYSDDKATHQKLVRKMEELKTGKGLIPTIALCETLQLVCTRDGKEKANLVYFLLLATGIKFEPLSPSVAKEAGVLKSTHKNVPIGDCIIAATAIANQMQILSDDPHFNLIKGAKRTWI
jgi:predicted nucleic acid-binding protein